VLPGLHQRLPEQHAACHVRTQAGARPR
jgi:hypothetical protein